MAETFKFELVSPERLLISADVKSVLVPGDEGDFVVLANHAPMMSVLRPGLVVLDGDGGEQRFYVDGGFSDMGPSGLTILAEHAANCADLKGDALEAERKAAAKTVDAAEGDAAKRHASVRVACLDELS